MSSAIVPSIRSRPVYGVLHKTSAPAWLLVADADGGAAVHELASQLAADVLARSEILYLPARKAPAIERTSHADAEHPGMGSDDHGDALISLGCPGYYTGPGIDAMLPRLARSIERMRMGTQIGLAGSETLIGRAMKTAMDSGIDYQGIQTEHRGTLARRMQCVHCKGITENVTTQPADCSHCGLLLLVRDHYSRRHAAFQGVNINAEDPSVIPEKEEVFR